MHYSLKYIPPSFSALYSYNDWHKLKVRNMDLSFVYEVLTEGIKILNNCELYSKYQDERNARFKITPRKVTEVCIAYHPLGFLVYMIYNQRVDLVCDSEFRFYSKCLSSSVSVSSSSY